jgi:hypothetical protein
MNTDKDAGGVTEGALAIPMAKPVTQETTVNTPR